jgi:hypothetical protein
MARIAKPGLEYFPFDIDLFQDIRIRKLIKRQGGKAVTIYALLLCLIYKNGYYMRWDKELPFICSETTGFDQVYISEVIKSCLSLGLFDAMLFETENVLTSKGIQQRYCNIQRQNKRKSRIEEYSLLTTGEDETITVQDEQPKQAEQPEQSEQSEQPQPSETLNPDELPSGEVAETDDNRVWLERFFADNGNQNENLKLLCKNFGLMPEDIPKLRTLAEATINEWELSNTTHFTYNDWSRHLISVMRVKNREQLKTTKTTTTKKKITPKDAEETDYTYRGGFGSKDT